jgi:hypothetical protein
MENSPFFSRQNPPVPNLCNGDIKNQHSIAIKIIVSSLSCRSWGLGYTLHSSQSKKLSFFQSRISISNYR